MAVLDFGRVETEDGDSLQWGSFDVVWTFGISPSAAPTGFTVTDYLAGLVSLLPAGDAWGANSFMYSLLLASATEAARFDAAAQRMVAEADPSSSADLLSDWERLVGLPDPCVTVAQTSVERRLALTSRLAAAGTQSRAFFVQLAQRLGYDITIDEFRSADEASAAGVVFTGDGWAHTWRVNVPVATGVRHFAIGSGVGEPLQSWGDQALECQFHRFKPAHTVVIFAYAA